MSAPPPSATSVLCAIAHANHQFVTALFAQNVHAIAHHYVPQGRLLLTKSEPIYGRFAIQAFWQGMIDMGLYCTARITLEVQSSADLCNEIGLYTFRIDDGRLVEQGTYVTLWQWSGQAWQIRYDVWHSCT